MQYVCPAFFKDFKDLKDFNVVKVYLIATAAVPSTYPSV